MPEDTRAFKVDRSLEPLLSNDDPVYYVESLFNLPNMDYLGGAYFHVSSFANKTLTIPHGRGLIYYQGVIVSDFQHGRLNGETNIILDNGSHLKSTFKEGCILEATMTFHNGVTVIPSFDRENQYEGSALFCLPSGETIEAEFLGNRLIRSARIMDSSGRELDDMSALLKYCGFDKNDLYNFYFILESLLEIVPIDLSGVSGKSDYCIIEEGVIEEGVIEEGVIEEGVIEEGVIEEGVIEEEK